jgi:protein-disulfide isomerase
LKNQKIVIAASALILVLAFIVGRNYYKGEREKEMGFLASENIDLFIRDHSPTMGSDKAKVIIVEFLDPECETCRDFYPFVKKLMADNPGKIRLVLRYTPFHQNAKFVIRILEAARKQGKFWESLGILFKYQSNWGGHHNPRPELVWDYLPMVGVNVEKIKDDMNNPATEKIIEQDITDGRKLKVQATPTFFINGKPLKSFGYRQLQEAVEAELSI